MRYALLIYSATDGGAAGSATAEAPTRPQSADGVYDTWIDYTRALKNAGALLALERLQDIATATSVRVREGERLFTDGPFVETKEHLLGFYLIEAPGLDAALDWAARMPHVRRGTVEVRPVQATPVLTEIVCD